MAKIISVHSFRGGTGKSNVTANLAILLASAGKRVAIVDTDIQSPGIHVIFGMHNGSITRALNDFLYGRCPIRDAVYDVTATALPSGATNGAPAKVFLIPSSINSGDIAQVLREGYDVAMLNEGFQELLRQLELDYLLVDTHPGVNEETLLSIAVSDVLVLLMRPDQQDFQGTAVTIELARRLQVARMLLVVNKVAPSMDRQQLRELVEKTYNVTVGGLLPLNFEIVQNASGALFVNQQPEHPFSRELKFVAQRLTA